MMRSRAMLLLCLFTCAAPSVAQDAFAGKWHVIKAERAPWVGADSKWQPAAEAAFARASFEFRADRVAGPTWTACRKPKYEFTAQPFDGLFEGGLYDPDHGVKDAAALAHRLGFRQEPVPSMSNSCSELQFHMLDANTVLFALNNMIYTMKRERE